MQMTKRQPDTIHMTIGDVSVSLSTPIRALRRQYIELYRDFQTAPGAKPTVRVEVTRSAFSTRHRRTYDITVNGRHRFAPSSFNEVLPYVEWGVNWELSAAMPQYLQLHASSFDCGGQGVVLAGVSGSGKSTLTLGLIRHGWRYLCDEFALVNTESLRLHPFPRAICIKKHGFDVASSLGIDVPKQRHYRKGTKGQVVFINPLRIRPASLGRICPIRFVVLPQYVPGAAPTLSPINRAEAALEMHHLCFNLFGCRSLGVDVLANMIRQTQCYRLTSGDLNETCALLTDMVEASGQSRAKCA